MCELDDAGGVQAVLAELAKKNLINTSLITATGKTIAENIKGVKNRNPEILRPIENPFSDNGGIAVLFGNLAPDGTVVKRSACAPELMNHTGPARVFNDESEAMEAVQKAQIKAGDVVEVPEKNRKVAILAEAQQVIARRGSPAWLELDGGAFRGVIKTLPQREDIQTPINEDLIVELYSK